MKLTQQEEIGLRCMVQMAQMQPAGSLAIPDIAEREALTTAYVAKLMRLLRMAGLVRSIRGQKGGYELTRDPEDIRVSEILAALGKPIHRPELCRLPDRSGKRCVHAKDCSIRALRWGIDLLVIGLMSQCSLSDLLAGERAMRRQVQAHIDELPRVVKGKRS
jgi:Rrf2 family protein